MRKNTRITVLGGGLWGTVLASHLLSNGEAREVRLWEFFAELAAGLRRSRRHPHLPGFRLDDAVLVTSDLGEAAAGAQVVLFVLPSGVVRRTARGLRQALRGSKPVVVNASKGLEPGTLLTMGDVIGSELPQARAVYTLSGPSFAREVARGVPTKMLLAGPAGNVAEEVRRLFDGGALRVELTRDRRGVELGGSLKNVLAIGCGVLDGLRAGANTKAALIIQGMSEMGRVIAACGGSRETIYGLSGLGDLIATGTSPESRNRAFGEKLGQGKALQDALREIPTVVEGIESSASACQVARRHRLKTPLIDAIWRVVHRGDAAGAVVQALGFE